MEKYFNDTNLHINEILECPAINRQKVRNAFC